MRSLEKVEKPQYEKMSDQWKNKVTKAVKLYMDNSKNSDENLLISAPIKQHADREISLGRKASVDLLRLGGRGESLRRELPKFFC